MMLKIWNNKRINYLINKNQLQVDIKMNVMDFKKILIKKYNNIMKKMLHNENTNKNMMVSINNI